MSSPDPLLEREIRADPVDNVESAGQYRPEELIPEAIDILLKKISDVEVGLDKLFEDDATAA